MIPLTQIIILLQVALSLLGQSAGTPNEQSAKAFATQAVVLANVALKQSLTSNIPQSAPSTIPEIKTPPAPQNTQNIGTAPVELPIQTPKPMKTLEIVSPMPTKGLGRTYEANAYPLTESNYLEIGVTVLNEKGEYEKSPVVSVTTTDAKQNKVINGTGTVMKIYKNEVKSFIHYYPFHYEFLTSGEHTITFTLESGESTSVTLTAK